MMSYATRLTALLIAFLFLGATAQCSINCLPTQKVPPCHRHGHQKVSCVHSQLTAERSVATQAPAPVLFVSFLPVTVVAPWSEAPQRENFVLAPGLGLKTTVLLI
jgi:hypothetical protein